MKGMCNTLCNTYLLCSFYLFCDFSQEIVLPGYRWMPLFFFFFNDFVHSGLGISKDRWNKMKVEKTMNTYQGVYCNDEQCTKK